MLTVLLLIVLICGSTGGEIAISHGEKDRRAETDAALGSAGVYRSGDEQPVVPAGDSVDGVVIFCAVDSVFVAPTEFCDPDFGFELCGGSTGCEIYFEGRSERGAVGGSHPGVRGRGAGGGGLRFCPRCEGSRKIRVE